MKRIKIGSTLLDKKYCPNCEDYTLSNTEELLCSCGTTFQDDKQIQLVILNGQTRRKQGNKVQQTKVRLEQQFGKCYWCRRDISMGFYIYLRGKSRKLKPVLDHRIPYNYCQNNQDLVVSCDRCNGYKSGVMVYDEDKTRDYINAKWDRDISKGKVSELMEIKDDKIIQFD